MECLAGAFEQLHLLAREVEVGLLAVEELARCAAERYQRHVVVGRQRLQACNRNSHLHGARQRHEHREAVGAVGAVAQILGGDVGLVFALQVAVQLIARLSQSVEQRYGVGAVDVARARTAGDEVVRGASQQRYALYVARERKRPVVVLQQHHTLRRAAARNGCMRFEVGFVRVLVAAETWRAHDHFEYALHVAVEHRLVESTVLDALYDLLVLLVRTRLQHVVAGDHLCSGILAAEPVGHDHAAEAPLVAQQRCEQLGVLRGIYSVEVVVRRHYRPRIRLLDGDLEAFEIELPEGALRYAGIVAHAVGLLIVDREVLDRGAHAVALHAAHVCGGYLARYERIFRVVLEVAAAQRVAVQVQGRCQQHVGAVFEHLLADSLTYALDQLRVPCRRQKRTYGEVGAVVCRLVVLARGVDAQAGGAVCQHHGRYSQTLYWVGRAGGSRDEVAGLSDYGVVARVSGHAGAHDQMRLLFEGHRCDHIVDRRLSQTGSRRRASRGRSREQRYGYRLLHRRMII